MSHKEDNEGKRSPHHTELYTNIPRTCLPIVYHSDYNITFMGLEKLHPFDAGKWGKVIRFLKGRGIENSEGDWEDISLCGCMWSLSGWIREVKKAKKGSEQR